MINYFNQNVLSVYTVQNFDSDLNQQNSCSSFQALFIRFCTNDVYLCVPAVDWVLQQGQLVVPSSPVALVRSGLSHMADVTTRAHFSVALVNGLSANLTDASRQIFVKQVSRDNVCAVPLTFICFV